MMTQSLGLRVGGVAGAVLTVLGTAGCGDDGRPENTASTPMTSTFPITTDDPTGTTAEPTSTSAPTTSTTTPDDSSSGGGMGGEGEPCTFTPDCAAGLICAGGECAPGEGACVDDDDCSGDAYCCSDGCLPVGETGGTCVPYGDGEGNDVCEGKVAIGLFEPAVQCEWSKPPDGDPYPDHTRVLATPLIFNLPHGGGENPHGELIVVTYNFTDGGSESGWGSNPAYYGVIRILHGASCAQLETIDDSSNRVIAASAPAIGDIDGDGFPEIVAQRAGTGLVAFAWNEAAQKYQTKWASSGSSLADTFRWDGPSLHDLDDDGVAEVVSGSEVYDGLTGTRLNPGQLVPGADPTGSLGKISVVGDVDGDGAAELLGEGVWRWNVAMNLWELAYPGSPAAAHYGFADFGTPGADPASFDPTKLDGRAEIVAISESLARLYTLEGQLLLSAPISLGGGPPTIGDFDNDGYPEFASAGGEAFSLFDFDCAGQNPECVAPYVRWTQPSQDSSSRNTGSSIFDFEGDGAAEAVYADECFLRVYEGATGEVLYSAFRTSCTWFENPVIGDPDFDQNTEILVPSNDNCAVACPQLDPIHRGVRCETAADCVAPSTCDAGFCRCLGDAECQSGHLCADALPNTPGVGKVCRAFHPPGVGLNGLRVLRDSLDRWASSRALWNQHAYSVTNINDNGSMPKTSQWPANFKDPALNNFRQNRQGDVPPDALPDLTGELGDGACTPAQAAVTLRASVCNRGTKSVGAGVPASFYLGDPQQGGTLLCAAFTQDPIPVGECREVACDYAGAVDGAVTVVVDDDGQGDQVALECFEGNNTDLLEVAGCAPTG
jgi:hypothetical protein